MIQSWNKLCFTGGYIEISVLLPGHNNVVGYWPGAWTMLVRHLGVMAALIFSYRGNLARAGKSNLSTNRLG